MKTLFLSAFLISGICLTHAQVKTGEQPSTTQNSGQVNDSYRNSSNTKTQTATSQPSSSTISSSNSTQQSSNRSSSTSGVGRTSTPQAAKNNSLNRDNGKASAQ